MKPHLIGLSIAFFSLLGCAQPEGTSPRTAGVPVETIRLSQTSVTAAVNFQSPTASNVSLSATYGPQFVTPTPTFVWSSSDPLVATVNGSGLSAVVTPVGPGTARIRVQSGSVYQDCVVVFSPSETVAPGVVSNLVATPYARRVVLTWDDPVSADLKTVRIASPVFSSPVSVGAGVKTLTIWDLAPNTPYSFTATSVDFNGNEASAVSVSTTTGSSAGVNTSVGSPVVQTVLPGTATVSWVDPASATHNHVLVKVSPTGGVSPASTRIAEGVQSATFTGLSVGTLYTFELTTYDDEGYASPGVTVTYTAASTDSNAPSAVTGLAAAKTDLTGQALLTWTDPSQSDLASIVVTDNVTATVRTVASGVQRLVVSSLSVGTAYSFTVRAKDTSGNQSTVATVNFTPTNVVYKIFNDWDYDSTAAVRLAVLTHNKTATYNTYDVVVLDPNESGNAAFPNNLTWIAWPGLADGSENTVSFESTTQPGRYLWVDFNGVWPTSIGQWYGWNLNNGSIPDLLKANLTYAQTLGTGTDFARKATFVKTTANNGDSSYTTLRWYHVPSMYLFTNNFHVMTTSRSIFDASAASWLAWNNATSWKLVKQ